MSQAIALDHRTHVNGLPLGRVSATSIARGTALQRFCASMSLFLLPFPTLNFGVSFTFADAFLLVAMVLNLHELVRVQAFQVPFILAFPFFCMSAILDPDSNLESLAQVVYIWGLIVPFGWIAFTNIRPRRIAEILIASAVLNSVVASLQGAGIIGELGRQKLIAFDVGFNNAFNRGPGLSLNCNSLVMLMTPVFLLLPYIRSARLRSLLFLVFLGGIGASMSKSTIMALPGILYWLWREKQKKEVFATLAVFMTVAVLVLSQSSRVNNMVHKISTTIERRATYVDTSISTRTELIEVAVDYAKDCLFLGYGTTGSYKLISQSTGHNVHVYYIGLTVIAGVPAMLLLTIGMMMQTFRLWRLGEVYFAMFLLAHMLACLLTTVLYLSFQSLPLMVAGAIIPQTIRWFEERQQKQS
ncbi:MAG: hypothetical protein CMJ78_21315 [Planctomycetaceae bacterium]|nr:hypothetical protein [Planctomycetaceae bacterium]